jgi:F-type H+-transporting ATPase subunit delta
MAEINKPYARALFELAIENGSLDSVYLDVLKALEAFHKEHRFVEMLNCPKILQDEKEALLKKVFFNLDHHLTGLLILMIKKGRVAYIEDALSSFIELAKEDKGMISAYVYSAVMLTDEQQTALQYKLSAAFGKQVEIEASVDPSLIGGLLVKAGGVIFDNTIKKHLHTLKKRLA